MATPVSLTLQNKIEEHGSTVASSEQKVNPPLPDYSPIISPLQPYEVARNYEVSNAGSAVFTKNVYRRVKVVRVVDGDTIVVDIPGMGKKTVRYIGIDTPETKHPRKGVEPYGPEASEANRKLLEGRKVTLKLDIQKFDRWRRLLAYVYVWHGPKRIFVNAWLVKKGYAQVSTYPPNVKYQQKFLRLQRKAREKGRGLWGIEKRGKIDDGSMVVRGWDSVCLGLVN